MEKTQQSFIDLSHIIEDGMITYKGLPAPLICDFLSREDSSEYYEEGTTFQIGKIEMVGNTGTYIDSPFHRYASGDDISGLSLDQLIDLEGIVIDAVGVQEIGISFFQDKNLTNKAVLVRTNWSQYWRTDQYFENHPFLTGEAANFLKKQGVKLVGIDSPNIDDTRGKARPVHSELLGNNILIVEHLCNLQQLPDEEFLFSAVPPKIIGVGSFPVRAFAKVGRR